MGIKMGLLLGAGVGYVLGTKAGRERYEQIRGVWRSVTSSPKVQQPVQNVSNKVTDAVRAQGEKMTDRVADAVKDRLFNGGAGSRPRASEYVDVEVEFPDETGAGSGAGGPADPPADDSGTAEGGSWSAYK